MALHVSFWELNAYGEDSDGEDDTSELEGNYIHSIVAMTGPAAGIKYAGTIRT